MKTYIAQRQISHDNQVYEASDPLELDDKTAAPLIAVGAVEEKRVDETDSETIIKTSKKAK